jgi:hypothetical protein
VSWRFASDELRSVDCMSMRFAGNARSSADIWTYVFNLVGFLAFLLAWAWVVITSIALLRSRQPDPA